MFLYSDPLLVCILSAWMPGVSKKTMNPENPENSLFSEENPEKNPENPEENPENILVWPIIPTGDDHPKMNTRKDMYNFGEWKVKWNCLDIEIESEKWNENVSKSRSRVKSELKMPRDRDREVKFLENFREILEKFLRIKRSRKFQILLQMLFI